MHPIRSDDSVLPDLRLTFHAVPTVLLRHFEICERNTYERDCCRPSRIAGRSGRRPGRRVATSIVALKTERRRQESKRHTTYVKALRKRSGATFAQFFIIVQEIEWISWYGANDPDAIDGQKIKSYEERVNEQYGTLLGSMAMTASLSLETYNGMQPILLSLYDLESRVGVALRKFRSERSAAIEELAACGSEATTLRDHLPPKLNDIMIAAETPLKNEEKLIVFGRYSLMLDKAAVLTPSRLFDACRLPAHLA